MTESSEESPVTWRAEVRQLGTQLSASGPLPTEALRDWSVKLRGLAEADRMAAAEQLVALGLAIERLKPPQASTLMAQVVLLVMQLVGGSAEKTRVLFTEARATKGPRLDAERSNE